MSPNHWSNEQLIDHLYGIGPVDAHMETCGECQGRRDAIRLSRRTIESSFDPAQALDHGWLAAQRRAIYRRIEAEARRHWWAFARPRWASAALAVALIGGGWAIHEESQTTASQSVRRDKAKVSDAELADQVSQIADDAEPQPAAPVEALFEN